MMIDSDYSIEGRRRSSEEREREWENEKRVRGWRRMREKLKMKRNVGAR